MKRPVYRPGGWVGDITKKVEFTEEQRAEIEATLPPGDIDFTLRFLENAVRRYRMNSEQGPTRKMLKAEAKRLEGGIEKTRAFIAGILPARGRERESNRSLLEICERIQHPPEDTGQWPPDNNAGLQSCLKVLDELQRRLTKVCQEVDKQALPGNQKFVNDHCVTNAAVFVWERHAKELPSRTMTGPFPEFLVKLAPIVGGGYAAEREIRWYIRQAAKWQNSRTAKSRKTPL